MTTRRRPRGPRVPEFHEGQLLDWSSSAHWNYDGPGPCRYCGEPTQLLDSRRHPAHKVCAEKALAAQYAEAQNQYREGVL
jgi:hypothetical protein